MLSDLPVICSSATDADRTSTTIQRKVEITQHPTRPLAWNVKSGDPGEPTVGESDYGQEESQRIVLSEKIRQASNQQGRRQEEWR